MSQLKSEMLGSLTHSEPSPITVGILRAAATLESEGPPDPDCTGFDFWLTKLDQFNGNFQNAEMVKAFISSIEYRQRFGP